MSQEKVDFVRITHEYLERNRALLEHTVTVDGMVFRVNAGVFSPLVFGDTAFFKRSLKVGRGDRFLEVGCGCGVIAIYAACRGATVVATDINAAAVENTLENAGLHGVEGRVSVRHGDLFVPLARTEEFDVIFWNAPFQREVCDPSDALACSVFDPAYRNIRRFLQQGPEYLALGGRLYLGFSSSSGVKTELNAIVAELNQSLLLCSATVLTDDESSDFSLELYQVVVDGNCVLT